MYHGHLANCVRDWRPQYLRAVENAPAAIAKGLGVLDYEEIIYTRFAQDLSFVASCLAASLGQTMETGETIARESISLPLRRSRSTYRAR